MEDKEILSRLSKLNEKIEQNNNAIHAQLKNESSRIDRELERYEKTQNIIINLMTGVIIAFFIVFVLIALDYFSHHRIHW